MSERRPTPTQTSLSKPIPDVADIHDTQASFDAVSIREPTAERPRDVSQSSDTLLEGPTPEDELFAELTRRIEVLETNTTELSARVRLLEKQNQALAGWQRWLLSLLFFLILALSWRFFGSSP
jgi:hypothetical protein